MWLLQRWESGGVGGRERLPSTEEKCQANARQAARPFADGSDFPRALLLSTSTDWPASGEGLHCLICLLCPSGGLGGVLRAEGAARTLSAPYRHAPRVVENVH